MINLFITNNIRAQNDTFTKVKSKHLEQILSMSAEDDNTVDDLVDKLSYKVDINHTNREELAALLILTPYQIESIINYVSKVGRLETIYELQLIKGIDKITLERLIPFVCIDSEYGHLRSHYSDIRSHHKLSLRYDQPLYNRKGDYTSFRGNSFYTAFRYACSLTDDISFGIVGEKDSGETFCTFNKDQGFDYYSYYLLIKNKYNFRTILLGKYKLQLGNGLIMGTPQYGGKWYSISSFFNATEEIKKHASVDEYHYLNGLALHSQFKNVGIIPFLSIRKKDGEVRDGYITSLNKTGLHRTSNEMEKKNKVEERCYGIRLSYELPTCKVGVNSLFYQFNHPLKKGVHKYMKYNIEGNNFYNLSVDYMFYYSHFILKGEAALSKRGQAYLHKLYYSPSTDWDLLLIHRFYAADYWGFYGKSFSNSSTLQNENGWYVSCMTKYFNPLEITIYADFFSSPWWKYRLSKPSQTIDMGLKIDYLLARNHSLFFQVNSLFKECDRAGTKGAIIDPIQLYKFKVQYDWNLLDWCNFKFTSGMNIVKGATKSHGFHLTPRVSFVGISIPFRCDCQCSFFHTTNFDSRVYIFEKGVLYSSYTPAFYGKGYRCSINLNYKWKKRLTLMAKYGLTYYLDRSSIGSGINEIEGNHKSDIQLMGVVNF